MIQVRLFLDSTCWNLLKEMSKDVRMSREELVDVAVCNLLALWAQYKKGDTYLVKDTPNDADDTHLD